MSRRPLLLIILVLITVIFFAIFIEPFFITAGGDNLIKNGSFELGNFKESAGENFAGDCNCKLLCGGSPSLDNWQTFKGAITAQNCATENDALAWAASPTHTSNIVAQDQNRFIDFTGDATKPPASFGGLQQTVEGIQTGLSYELSFFVGSSSFAGLEPPSKPGQTPFYSVTVEAEGLPGGKQAFTTTTPAQQVSQWEQHTLRFTAVGTAITVRFTATSSTNAGGFGGNYVGIDNVSLQRVCFFGRFLGCS